MRRHRIAVIPGDGIGLEVTSAALEVLEAAGRAHGFGLALTEFPWGCDRYVETRRMMPEDALETLSRFDAIFLGAVGRPDVPDHVSLWGLLIPIRRAFEQYVNLRPVRLWPGVPSPLRDIGPEQVDMLIVALAAMVVLDPGRFDVIVASNLFGDILSDLAAAVAGSIGIAPSANLNPERELPSMFEPVHGSAPDIAGQGIANPIGAIWSGAMMLDHLGEGEAAAAVLAALEAMLAGDGPRTRDLGGTATTADVAGA